MNGQMKQQSFLFYLVVFVGGLLFGLGLAVSRMVQPEVVLSFLTMQDFGLLLVMGAGATVTGLVLHGASRSRRTAPLGGRAYGLRHRELDSQMMVGGVIFGIGWGLSGVCPGAGFASLGVGNWPILLAIGGMFAGAYLFGLWKRATTAAKPGPASPLANSPA